MFTVNTDSALARWVGPHITNFGIFGTDNDHLIFIRSGPVDNNLTYSWLNGKWIKIKSPLDSIAWSAIYYHQKG